MDTVREESRRFQGECEVFELLETEEIASLEEEQEFFSKLDAFDRRKALGTILEAYQAGTINAIEAISSLKFCRLLPKARIANPEAWMRLYAQIQT